MVVVCQPNRDDEYARIEAAGGKVIQWNGHRVFGVLAMSRSIGMYFFNHKFYYICGGEWGGDFPKELRR